MSKHHQIQPVEAMTEFAPLEHRLLEHWYQSGVVTQYLHKNAKAKNRFSFFDGPITANNPMGVHHGWGRTYKDLWQRYHNLRGERQRFQNGFDCQGLWVEVEVEKELGFKSKKDIEQYGVEKFVNKCKERVLKFAAIQAEQSKRLGYFMDWNHSYFTMSDENNYMIWHFLKVCHENGWLYKGQGSVPWCPRCQTAISQHEMLTEDYKKVTHKAIYLELPVVGRQDEFLLVWTTTPWTIPANIAVAVDPKLDYSLVQGTSGDRFWVAKDAAARIFKEARPKIVKTVKGKELVGVRYQAPFDHLPAVAEVAQANPETFHKVVASDLVILPITPTEGTGLVHTAVSAGTEDFKLGKKLGLPMIPVIADDASYLEGLGFLSGKNAKKHPELILDYLGAEDKKGNDWVFAIENYKHRYPACWRCKTELVWKVTDEWYIAMDSRPLRNQKSKIKNQKDKTLRERMIAVAKKIKWLPKFGLDRELEWLTNMHDWLISKKNRYWGLALPIWECGKCGEFQVIGSKAELKEKVVAGWSAFEGKTPHKPQIDRLKLKCSCGALISRIEPVGNPWLDAGIIPFSTLVDPQTGRVSYTGDQKYWKAWFPAEFITESFPGQFKNWFYSLIAMSTVLADTNPFKTVLGFGTLLGEDNRPMHKSWGNAVEFNQGADKIGVDVMRWLYARQNPANNLLFGYSVASQVKRQFHLLLWNSYRFFANNAALEQWYFTKMPDELTALDRWLLSRLTFAQEETERFLDRYDAFHATQVLEGLVIDLSTWYIRRCRERVGPTAVDKEDKGRFLAVLYILFHRLSRILAPFIPFLTDEIFTNLTGQPSVHLADWPDKKQEWRDEKLESQMSEVRAIVELGHAARRKAAIKLRQPLALLAVSGLPQSLPDELRDLVKAEINVKQVDFLVQGDELSVKLNTLITPELRAEGEARELIRNLQEARKKAGCRLDERVIGLAPSWPKEFTQSIKQAALLTDLQLGETVVVKREA